MEWLYTFLSFYEYNLSCKNYKLEGWSHRQVDQSHALLMLPVLLYRFTEKSAVSWLHVYWPNSLLNPPYRLSLKVNKCFLAWRRGMQ